MSEEVKIKKEKTDDDDPDDVVPPPPKPQPVPQLMPPTEKSPYAEITVTGDEIRKLKEKASARAPEAERIKFHNDCVMQIQSGIRKAASRKEKKVVFVDHNLDVNRVLWKREVLKEIAAKMCAKQVRAVYEDDHEFFKVDL